MDESPDETQFVQQLHNLRIFIYVASEGSIARAAEHMFRAPSAITRSIHELERCVGEPLFERKPRGMLLNAYGETVLMRARRIHDEISEGVQDLLSTANSSASSSNSVINLLFSGRKLRLLILLAAYESITAVAARMDMTQAGVSMALARIEAVLGQTLFQRQTKGIVPTEAAERFVAHARRVFAELRHMNSDLSALSGNLAGSVVIGTTPLGRTDAFPTGIATAIAQSPGLHLTTVESTYDRLVASLRTGDIDMVFGVLRPAHLCHGLIVEPLFEDRLAVVVGARHPLAGRSTVSVSDLLSYRWIMPRPNSQARPLVDEYFRNWDVKPPTPALETGDLATIREVLVVSDLVAVTSPHQLMFELQSGTVVELPISLTGAARSVGLIVREGAMLPPAALAVLEAVRLSASAGLAA